MDAPPALVPLFLKSFVTAPLPRGSALPATRLELTGQAVDRRRLTEYQRVCGFRVQDVLPPTYLHLLAFPLSVQLMTDRSFPFALPGLVHIANEITQRRPVTADERVSLTVRAENLTDHPAGRQVDLVAAASVDGEPVWQSRSTYLRRGGGSGPRGDRSELAPQAGPVAVVRVPGDIGRRYAAVSGDRNPIHLHPLTARAFGFPKAIAHGMWLKARVLASLEAQLPPAFVVETAFKTPVLLPATVAVSTPRAGDGWALDVRDARSGKPHLFGSVRPLSR